MSELIYTIDPLKSKEQACLALCIHEAMKEGYTHRILATRPLTKSLLEKIAPSQDQSLIAALIKEEMAFQKRLNKPNDQFNLIRISYPQTLGILELLAGTGNFYFKERQIVADLYGRAQLSIFVQGGNCLKASGRIKSGNQEFNLQECDFICNGTSKWYIKGISLKILSTDIEWSDFKELYYSPENFSKERLQELIKEEKELFIFEDNGLEKLEAETDPLPILMLKDRSGAFADLWMDYGAEKKIPFHSLKMHENLEKSKRKIDVEKGWEKDLLETDFVPKIVSTTHYYCPLDKVAKSLTFLLELGWKIFDWKGNRVIHQQAMKLDLQTQKDTIFIKGKVRYDEYETNLSEVIGAFNRRERFLQLAQGTVGLLPEKWDALSDLIEEGEIVQDTIKIKKNKMGILKDVFETNTPLTMDNETQQLREKIHSFQSIEEVKPGSAFCGTLRPYQVQGLNWLNFLYEYGFNGILADDMGLGKTVQVLAFLSRLEITAPVLIVLPTSLLFNWKREIEQFIPSWKVFVHHASNRMLPQDANIILTTYTTLRIDLSLFSKIDFQCIILDEAQTIKNSETQIAQAVFGLKAKFRLSITGTPIENHIGELWSQFRFLMPDLLGDKAHFLSELQAGSSDSRYLQKIKKQVRPFILRRKKEDVAKDLPERIEQLVWIEMGQEQRHAYETLLAHFKGNLLKKVELDGARKHRMEILEAILRLRQICCHPLLATSVMNETPSHDSAKLDLLLQDLETMMDEGKKVLVYSQFTSMLHLIAKEARKRNWDYVSLDGSTTHREQVVTRFQEDASTRLFLISLKAGGIGLNLTAADYVLLYDPWWNDALESQAINRAHRIGRQGTVIAKRYVVLESIEEKMVKLKASKTALIQDLLTDEMAQTHLSQEDLLFLLS
jgi:SNF2 family DNA or RNA helicase